MKTQTCDVCGYSDDRAMIRCLRCAWEIRGPGFLDSLTGLEQERYFKRRDLVRARWKELHQYDQTPRRESFPAEVAIIRSPTSACDLAIGGGLL